MSREVIVNGRKTLVEDPVVIDRNIKVASAIEVSSPLTTLPAISSPFIYSSNGRGGGLWVGEGPPQFDDLPDASLNDEYLDVITGDLYSLRGSV